MEAEDLAYGDFPRPKPYKIRCVHTRPPPKSPNRSTSVSAASRRGAGNLLMSSVGSDKVEALKAMMQVLENEDVCADETAASIREWRM